MEHESVPEGSVGGGREYSSAEREERRRLGVSLGVAAVHDVRASAVEPGGEIVRKRAIHAPDVLNEAPDYPQPASFSRGLRVDLRGPVTQLFLSGTASVGPNGESLYPGDFRAQCWRAYGNLTELLKAERASWHDVVKCTCYLRDIERDYADFNDIRTEFFEGLKLDPLPASTAIQARLCRSDLLVEIDAVAIVG